MAEIPLRARFRARLIYLRQRIIIQIRWWFRLPIDELRDADLRESLRIQRELSDMMGKTVALLNHANKRLKLYEDKIPRMRDLRRQFDKDEKEKQKNGKAQKERLEHGVMVQ